MKYIKLSILLIISMLYLGCKNGIVTQNHSEKKAVQPNIILFLVDDLGWQDTSVAFWDKKTPLNETYQTPHLERLASQGVKFTQAYATPICSPSRISLLTGSNAARHRVTNWTLEYNKSTDEPNSELNFPKWNVNGVSNDPQTPNAFYAKTLPELLQEADYHTIQVGKAHFASMGTPCADPLNMGFNVNVSGHAGGGLQSYLGEENFGNIPFKAGHFAVPMMQDYYGKDIFATEALTQKAIKELDKRPKNKPFFLKMSHYAVHTPIMGDKRFLQKYLDKGMHPTEAKYATLIEGVDKSLGDLMQYLEKEKIAENTVILFLSDNGGLDALARGLPKNSCNFPLSSGKGTLKEGGIRIPMVVSWKGKIKPNQTNHTQIIIEDIFPSILEMARVKNFKTPQVIDGQSITPLLLNENSNHFTDRNLIWHVPNQWFHTDMSLSIAPSSAIRKGDYKLIYYHNTQQMELFNLSNDISETTNLAEKNPKKTAELAEILSDYLRSVQAQMPSKKDTGQLIPLPSEALKKNK